MDLLLLLLSKEVVLLSFGVVEEVEVEEEQVDVE